MTLWLDDVQKQSITFIDNDTRTLTDVRLGVQGIETSTRGTIYFDDPSIAEHSGQASRTQEPPKSGGSSRS